MSASDITRRLFQPDKRYSGVVRLQGAVLLDSDENEREAIATYEERAAINDAVGANGTTNDGFRIDHVVPGAGNQFDLYVKAGSYFLGGQRFQAPADFGLLSQPDWIGAGTSPALPDHTTDKKFFVWLEGHEQTVGAREDSELLEAALNGVETSARIRAMTRVRITATPRDTCIDALQDVIDAEVAAGGAYDPATGALTGAARMKVGFVTGGATEDLCTPAAQGGYLGADNETIRVQVTAPGFFVWGVSNAAPVYRVQLSLGAGGKYTRVKMITPPWDQVSQPKAGDVVEFLPWGAKLPNGEKVAVEDGAFARVASSFATADGTFDIEENDAEIKPIMLWLGSAAGQAFYSDQDDPAVKAYVYMRVWRGQTFNPGQKQLAMNPAGVTLGNTGLTVTFTGGQGRRGDYYVFSVRPHTPDTLVPWAFGQGTGGLPTGPRRLLAALAFIDYNQSGPGGVPLIEDCRRRFRPLSHASSCCEITVGDGVHSHGDFTSIQAAVDALPPEGGKVCVLKGTYKQTIDITARKFVTIEGCGELTRIELDDATDRSLIAIRDSRKITIRNMALAALHDIAVTISTGQDGCADIVLEKLAISGRDAPAVMAAPVDGFALRDCDIDFETLNVRVTDVTDTVKPGTLPGVVVGGDQLTIEDNRIRCEAEDVLLRPFGGIHILSGSRIVRIRRNELYRLGGMGVALGSYRFIDDPAKADSGLIGAAGDGRDSYAQYFKGDPGAYGYYVEIFYWPTEDGCGSVIVIIVPPAEGQTWEVDVGDPIEDLAIIDNTIADTGLSGISVLRFFDQETYPVMIAIEGLEIRHNRIERAARTQLPVLTGSMRLHAGFGGITLAGVDTAVFADNRVSDCGGNARDPYCGVFVLRGRALVFENNRILDNGGAPEMDELGRFGQRGGVVIGLASAPLVDHPLLRKLFEKAKIEPRFPRGAGALRFTDNVVVQPEGRALQVMADGPLMINDNELVSRGSSEIGRLVVSDLIDAVSIDVLAALQIIMGGSVVSVMSLPQSLNPLLEGYKGDDKAKAKVKQYITDLLLYRGEVMIDDNRIVFDALNDVFDLAVAAVTVYGADAVAFCDNQCQTNMLPGDAMAIAQVLLSTVDSVRANDNTVRHPVTPADSQGTAAGAAPADHVPVNEFSIAAVAPVIGVMLNHLSGEVYTHGQRVLVQLNQQLFPMSNI